MEHCETCEHWKPQRPAWIRPEGGICVCRKLNESADAEAYGEDCLTYDYDEGGSFWTGPKFGCVHHGAKEGE